MTTKKAEPFGGLLETAIFGSPHKMLVTKKGKTPTIAQRVEMATYNNNARPMRGFVPQPPRASPQETPPATPEAPPALEGQAPPPARGSARPRRPRAVGNVSQPTLTPHPPPADPPATKPGPPLGKTPPAKGRKQSTVPPPRGPRAKGVTPPPTPPKAPPASPPEPKGGFQYRIVTPDGKKGKAQTVSAKTKSEARDLIAAQFRKTTPKKADGGTYWFKECRIEWITN